MRIRRRPPLQPSSSLSPDPPLQPPPKEERASGGLHPDGDLPDPPLQTLPPQHNTLQVPKEEEIQLLDDSPSQQTLSWRAGSAAEVPFGAGLAWCNGESAVAVPRKRRGSRVGEDDAAKATKPVSSSNSIAPGNSSSSNNNSSNNNAAAGGGGGVVMGEEEGKRKKRVSPTVLMEGSRCSRVNGRGWRCCQQTLVGYSLCEHHLGKGRLRSMSSVRGSKLSGAATTTATKHKNVIGGTTSAAVKQEEEEGERQQCLGANDHSCGGNKGRKKKVGALKARSISTLLDETDHAAAAIISSLAVPVLEIDKGLV